MKTPRKIKRIKLALKEQNEPAILLLVTPDPDYKITLKINSALNISLRGSEPLIIDGNNGNELTFSKFTDDKTVHETIFNLISNRSGKNYLLKKLKNVDYVLVIHGPSNYVNLELTINILKDIDSITAVFSIDTKNLIDKNMSYLL
jgi:hypothetical protein